MDIGYFLDIVNPGGLVTFLIVPLIALIIVVVLAIIIIHEVVTYKKDKNADSDVSKVSPKDWAENRNEEKDIDN